MKKALSTLVIVVLLSIPVAVCEIDTSAYTDLASRITLKQAELEAARGTGDWDAMTRLGRELEGLEAQLMAPNMRFLKKYANLQPLVQEAQQLITQGEESLGMDIISSSTDEFNHLLQSLSEAESFYNSLDYSSAVSMMLDIEESLAGSPASLTSAFAEGTDTLRGELERTSQVTPSTISMLEDAKEVFAEASQIYGSAAESALLSRPEEVSSLISRAREKADQAIVLVQRAKAQGGALFDGLKLLLIFGPIALIVGLLAYFYFQFKRAVIQSTMSADTAPSGAESDLERTITVTNLEKVPVAARLYDAPPKALAVSSPNPEPRQKLGNEMVWEFELGPGESRSITYKLDVPKLASGWTLRVPAPTVAYSSGGKLKKFVGSPSTVTII